MAAGKRGPAVGLAGARDNGGDAELAEQLSELQRGDHPAARRIQEHDGAHIALQVLRDERQEFLRGRIGDLAIGYNRLGALVAATACIFERQQAEGHRLGASGGERESSKYERGGECETGFRHARPLFGMAVYSSAKLLELEVQSLAERSAGQSECGARKRPPR